MITDLAIIVASFAILVWSADRFIDGAAAIAKSLGMSPLLIGMTIVSVGTSAPEIIVSFMSALTGAGSLAVGNALGSNIANVGLVLGITLVISPIVVGRVTAFSDLPLLLGTILLCALLLADQVLSLLDTLILLAGLGLFLWRMARHKQQPDEADEVPAIPSLSPAQAWWLFALGLLLLVASSRALVFSAVNIATHFGVSELVIGLTIVAVGTSLPELAASLLSAIRGHADIAIGAVVGSNMFNLLVVLSLPGLFGSLQLEPVALTRDLSAVLITTSILAAATWLAWNKQTGVARLGRRLGSIFFISYVLYYGLLFYDMA
jgi:cation:H+ antiporter